MGCVLVARFGKSEEAPRLKREKGNLIHNSIRKKGKRFVRSKGGAGITLSNVIRTGAKRPFADPKLL